MCAIATGHHEIFELLLKAGANLNQINDDSESTADLAEMYGTAEIKAMFSTTDDSFDAEN